MGSLLGGCSAEILQLDVLGLHFPPDLDPHASSVHRDSHHPSQSHLRAGSSTSSISASTSVISVPNASGDGHDDDDGEEDNDDEDEDNAGETQDVMDED